MELDVEDEICSFRTIIQFKMGDEEPRQNSAAYSTVDARLHYMRCHKAEITRVDVFAILLLQPAATEIVTANTSSFFLIEFQDLTP